MPREIVDEVDIMIAQLAAHIAAGLLASRISYSHNVTADIISSAVRAARDIVTETLRIKHD